MRGDYIRTYERKPGLDGMFAIKAASMIERRLVIEKGGDIYGHSNHRKAN